MLVVFLSGHADVETVAPAVGDITFCLLHGRCTRCRVPHAPETPNTFSRAFMPLLSQVMGGGISVFVSRL